MLLDEKNNVRAAAPEPERKEPTERDREPLFMGKGSGPDLALTILLCIATLIATIVLVFWWLGRSLPASGN